MNRKINIDNYEEFFIDYLDGNLSDQEIMELEKFLLKNPDLRTELEGLENIKLSPEEAYFPDPEKLKQIDLSLPVTDDNFDFYCIAELEGDLSEQQVTEFQKYLKENPEKDKERNLILKTRLNADKSLIYSDKNIIKKSIFVLYRREISAVAAVAAGIALLLTFWFSFMENEPQINEMAIADDKEKQTTEVVDSTSAAIPKDASSEKTDKTEKGVLKNIEEKSKQAVKKAATKISFKTGIPIASADTQPDTIMESQLEDLSKDEILRSVSINTYIISQRTPLEPISNDALIPEIDYIVKPGKIYDSPEKYLTLQEFAVQKLSDLIFREEEKELNAVNLASAGIEKVNDLAGTNMKLEASAKEETGEKVLSFNSKLISFSTPINRED